MRSHTLRIFDAISGLLRAARRHWPSLGVRSATQETNPLTADYEKVGLIWRPYVMRLSRPAQSTASVATDATGFRVALHRGSIFQLAEYRGRADASVVLGNSVAFGVGASSDERSLANQLASITDRPWFNLSGRASNLMQDVLALLLFGAPKHQDIVLMSGINDLLFALHFEHAVPYFPTFWGEDQFSNLNSRDSSAQLDEAERLPVEKRYLLAIEGIDRSLLLLARYGFGARTHVLFALQPLLAWLEKPLHAREAAVCAEWNTVAKGFRATHNPETIRPWKDRFTRDIRALCEKHGLDFMDLNAEPSMLTPEHLFADRIHLTDRGQQLVARLIAERLQSFRTDGADTTAENRGVVNANVAKRGGGM